MSKQDETARVVQARVWGERLKSLRLSRKRTVTWTARECGMNTSNYIRIERGEKAIRLDTLIRILNALEYVIRIVREEKAGRRRNDGLLL